MRVRLVGGSGKTLAQVHNLPESEGFCEVGRVLDNQFAWNRSVERRGGRRGGNSRGVTRLGFRPAMVFLTDRDRPSRPDLVDKHFSFESRRQMWHNVNNPRNEPRGRIR